MVEARGKLHGDGACAAGPARGDMTQDRHAEGAPVDAVMIVESPVLGCNDGASGRARSAQRNPLQAPPRRVHAHLVDDGAVPVQEQGIGEAVRSAHLFKGWKQRPGEIQSGRQRAQEGRAADQDGRSGEPPTFYRQTIMGLSRPVEERLECPCEGLCDLSDKCERRFFISIVDRHASRGSAHDDIDSFLHYPLSPALHCPDPVAFTDSPTAKRWGSPRTSPAHRAPRPAWAEAGRSPRC